jgi:hypothetical protein
VKISVNNSWHLARKRSQNEVVVRETTQHGQRELVRGGKSVINEMKCAETQKKSENVACLNSIFIMLVLLVFGVKHTA